MENQEIDASKATVVPDESVMLNIISSVIGSAYDKEKLTSDINDGKIKASDVMANPSILEKYLVEKND